MRVLSALAVFVALFCGATALAARAPAAFAEEATPAGGTSSLARLSPEEAEFLRRRFPDWEQKDAAERERIAANVLRLRSLSREERARLMERVRRAEQAGLVGTGKLSDRVGWWRDHGVDVRKRALQGHAATRAIAGSVVRSLPEESRRLLRGKDGPGTLSPLHRAAVESAIVTGWGKRAAEALVAAPPTDATPAADAPAAEATEFVRLRDETKRRGGASAPLDLRRAFAGAIVRDRVGAATRASLGPAGARPAAPPSQKDREAAIAALATALRDAFPAAHEALVREVGVAAGNGPEALVQWAWQQERAVPRSPAARVRRLVEFANMVENDRDLLRGSPEVLRRAEEFQAAIYVELGVTEAEQQRLREAKSPFERQRAWNDIKRRFLGRDAPGGRRGPRDGPPPAMDGRPAGMTDGE